MSERASDDAPFSRDFFCDAAVVVPCVRAAPDPTPQVCGRVPAEVLGGDQRHAARLRRRRRRRRRRPRDLSCHRAVQVPGKQLSSPRCSSVLLIITPVCGVF